MPLFAPFPGSGEWSAEALALQAADGVGGSGTGVTGVTSRFGHAALELPGPRPEAVEGQVGRQVGGGGYGLKRGGMLVFGGVSLEADLNDSFVIAPPR